MDGVTLLSHDCHRRERDLEQGKGRGPCRVGEIDKAIHEPEVYALVSVKERAATRLSGR